MTSTSRPKKPNTGQAPIHQNTTPAAKLTTLTMPISTINPLRLSERCGVSSAENSFGSSAGSKSLLAVMACQYMRDHGQNHPRSTRQETHCLIGAEKTGKEAGGQAARSGGKEISQST